MNRQEKEAYARLLKYADIGAREHLRRFETGYYKSGKYEREKIKQAEKDLEEIVEARRKFNKEKKKDEQILRNRQVDERSRD